MQYLYTVCSICGIADRDNLVGGKYTAHAGCARIRYGRWYERIGQAILNTISYIYYWVKAWVVEIKERLYA